MFLVNTSIERFFLCLTHYCHFMNDPYFYHEDENNSHRKNSRLDYNRYLNYYLRNISLIEPDLQNVWNNQFIHDLEEEDYSYRGFRHSNVSLFDELEIERKWVEKYFSRNEHWGKENILNFNHITFDSIPLPENDQKFLAEIGLPRMFSCQSHKTTYKFYFNNDLQLISEDDLKNNRLKKDQLMKSYYNPSNSSNGKEHYDIPKNSKEAQFLLLGVSNCKLTECFAFTEDFASFVCLDISSGEIYLFDCDNGKKQLLNHGLREFFLCLSCYEKLIRNPDFFLNPKRSFFLSIYNYIENICEENRDEKLIKAYQEVIFKIDYKFRYNSKINNIWSNQFINSLLIFD